MKYVCIAAVCALAAAPALAAEHEEKCFDKGTLSYVDCPKPVEEVAAPVIVEAVVDDWTGFYIGGHVGGGAAFGDALLNSSNLNTAANGSLSAAGFLYGAQVGYDYDFGNGFVVGVELDGSIADWDDEVAGFSGAGLRLFEVEQETKALASLRAKVGITDGVVMPYLTGGLGYMNYDVVASQTQAGFSQTFSEDAFAPVIGAGVSLKVTENIIVSGQALYFFFDEETDLSTSVPAADAGDHHELEGAVAARASIDFKF